MLYTFEQRTAIAAVLTACRLCEVVRSSSVSKETLIKKDCSPVTVADFGAQAVINLELSQAFPNDPIVAEEDAADLRSPSGGTIREKVVEHVNRVLPGTGQTEILDAIDRGTHSAGAEGRFWTVDPVDGTKGFLRGEQYAIALALIENGQAVLGVLGCPNLPMDLANAGSQRGSLFVAVQCQAAAVRPISDAAEVSIRVSDIVDPPAATFCESVESAHSSHSDAARVAELLGVTAPPLRMDSQAKYAAVARGDASIYLRLPTRSDYQEKIWDHAAGWIIVKEAGGEVTDVLGQPLDFSVGQTLSRNKGVVATNGRLHAQVLAAVRSTLQSS